MKKFNIETAVKAGILALGLGSFALSYEALFTVAGNSGIWHPLCWVYGFLTEGFVTIATLTAYVTRGTKASRYPWFVAVLAFGFSLWANSSPDTVPPGIVRSVPVVALPFAVHLLIVLMHANAEKATQPAVAPIVQTVEVEVVREVPVPAIVDHGIDPATVQNPELVAMKLLAHSSGKPSTKSYYARKFREMLAATESPELAAA